MIEKYASYPGDEHVYPDLFEIPENNTFYWIQIHK